VVHGLHHNMNRRVEKLLGIFGIKVPDELGGVFDIRE
jgi:hypothetical protein